MRGVLRLRVNPEVRGGEKSNRYVTAEARRQGAAPNDPVVAAELASAYFRGPQIASSRSGGWCV